MGMKNGEKADKSRSKSKNQKGDKSKSGKKEP